MSNSALNAKPKNAPFDTGIETSNTKMIAARIARHQQNIWMLRAVAA